MPEPLSLEQIAAGAMSWRWDEVSDVLARELIALRDNVAELRELHSRVSGNVISHEREIGEFEETLGHHVMRFEALEAKLESPDAEPDAALARWIEAAHMAQGERDEWVTKCCDWMDRCRIAITERDEARAAVERLRPYARHHDAFHDENGALTVCRSFHAQDCTCGLADALKEATR